MTPRSARTMDTPVTDEAPIAAPQFHPEPANAQPLADTSSEHDRDTSLDDLFFITSGPIVHTRAPDPIYPLQSGQTGPIPLPPLDPYRAHGFYPIYKGRKIGIFYNYWYDLLVQKLIGC
jgi:hypothetical protein